MEQSGPVEEKDIWLGKGDERAPDLAAGSEGYLVVLQQGPDGQRDVYGLLLDLEG